MNTNTKIGLAVLLSLIIGAAGGAAFARESGESLKEGSHHMSDGHVMDDDAMGMGHAMDDMMTGLSGKTGDAFDKAFLEGMIVHHQGAVEMSEAVLKHAEHAELKEMANNIIKAQTAEIEQMKEWQKSWYGTP
jgi:uncharacterized protein (DUF305 family)